MTLRALLFWALMLLACSATDADDANRRVTVPTMLEFDKSWVGEESRATLPVAATGTEPVTVERLTADSPDIRFEGVLPLTIAPGTTSNLVLRWRPSAPGGLHSFLRFTSNGVGSAGNIAPLGGRTLVVAVSGVAESIPTCDDQNECTEDRFVRASEQCVHAPREGSCDDGNACTTGDRCSDGICRGIAASCDDGDLCTLDLCDPTRGCVPLPDARRCADENPCTVDLCDSGRCSHVNAADGTTCGPRDCATARVCRGGSCQEVDVAGESDGMPCADADFCTVDDVCRGGSCQPGTPFNAPAEVIGTIETFGAEGDFLASDGFRFVFSTGTTTKIAVRDASGQLVVRGRVPLGSDLPPVFVAPGMFVVSLRSSLSLIDARDVDHPSTAWNSLVRSRRGEFDVAGLRAMPGALLIRHLHGELDLLTLPDPTRPPTTTHALLDDVRTFDADGPAIVADERWFTVQPDGAMTTPGKLSGTARRIGPLQSSIHGDLVALMWGASVELHRVTARKPDAVPCGTSTRCLTLRGACDPRFEATGGTSYLQCNDDEHCPFFGKCVRVDPACLDCATGCSSGTGICVVPRAPIDREVGVLELPSTGRAVLLTDGRLYVAMDDGIHAFALDPDGAVPSDAGTGTVVDPLSVDRLAAAPGVLLSSGSIALPFALAEMPHGPELARLTGPGHGTVTALVEGEGSEVVVAGPVATGVLNIQSENISRWGLTPQATSIYRPRMLLGAHSSRMVDDYAASGDGPASELPVQVVDRSLLLQTFRVGEFSSGYLEASGPLLVASVGSQPAVLEAWRMQPFSASPEWTAALPGNRVLRASGDGTLLGIGAGALGLAIVDLAGGASTARTYAVPWHSPDHFRRTAAASDGQALALGNGRMVELYRLTPTDAVAVKSLPQWNEDEGGGLAVQSMAQGRLWVQETGRTSKLSEFRYDTAATDLSFAGSVDLGEDLSQVLDLGKLTVATSPHAIRLIRPACR